MRPRLASPSFLRSGNAFGRRHHADDLSLPVIHQGYGDRVTKERESVAVQKDVPELADRYVRPVRVLHDRPCFEYFKIYSHKSVVGCQLAVVSCQLSAVSGQRSAAA